MDYFSSEIPNYRYNGVKKQHKSENTIVICHESTLYTTESKIHYCAKSAEATDL